jgi:glycine cleavage system aminomethyltransferase T
MTLGFLSPAVHGGSPPSESPIAAAAARGGARLEVRDGWRVPVTFGDEAAEQCRTRETVGVADASWLTKTQLDGPAEALDRCAARPSLGSAVLHRGAWWCRLTPTRAIVLGSEPVAESVEGLDLLDVSAQYCALRIAGPRCRDVMARFCALDLRPAIAPPTALRPGSVARTPGLVVVEETDQLLVLVGAALAEYFWAVVIDAAARLGGGPVGIDVLSGGALDLQEAGADA